MLNFRYKNRLLLYFDHQKHHRLRVYVNSLNTAYGRPNARSGLWPGGIRSIRPEKAGDF